MAWVALRDESTGYFDLSGIKAKGAPRSGPGSAVLERGTILIEYRHAPLEVHQNILRYTRRDPVPAAFILRADAGGGLRLLQRQGDRELEYTLATPATEAWETVRICYHWNAPRRTAFLSWHVPERGLMEVATFTRPFAMPALDFDRITHGYGLKTCDGFGFVAAADDIRPAGPVGGIGARTMVATPDGPRPASVLNRGDVVLTETGQARVVWAGITELPARGSLAPHLIRAPHYGLAEDAVLSAEQAVHLSGPEVEYLFDTPRVRIPAGALTDGVAALAVPSLVTVRYAHILLEGGVPLKLGKLTCEGFNPQALAARKVPHVLAGLPDSDWPSDKAAKPRLLAAFEAQSYLRHRAA